MDIRKESTLNLVNDWVWGSDASYNLNKIKRELENRKIDVVELTGEINKTIIDFLTRETK